MQRKPAIRRTAAIEWLVCRVQTTVRVQVAIIAVNPITIRHDNGYEDDDGNENCEDEKEQWIMYQASHNLPAQVVI